MSAYFELFALLGRNDSAQGQELDFEGLEKVFPPLAAYLARDSLQTSIIRTSTLIRTLCVHSGFKSHLSALASWGARVPSRTTLVATAFDGIYPRRGGFVLLDDVCSWALNQVRMNAALSPPLKRISASRFSEASSKGWQWRASHTAEPARPYALLPARQK